ncbi:uncharacterized protein LOC144118615 [Amblyomma americanum]
MCHYARNRINVCAGVQIDSSSGGSPKVQASHTMKVLSCILLLGVVTVVVASSTQQPPSRRPPICPGWLCPPIDIRPPPMEWTILEILLGLLNATGQANATQSSGSQPTVATTSA